MPTSSSHIVFSRLVDLVESRLSADETIELTSHLSGCQKCCDAERRLRGVLELMRTDISESAPADAMSRVIKMLPRAQQQLSTVKRILASLKLDTMGLSPAYGVRSEASCERQLLFEAGQTQLHLQITPVGEDWAITGQVLGPSIAGQVELKGESGSLQTALDERCEFVLSPVSRGSYWMVLRLNDLELEVPELKLGG
jgi:anti-sigma factor RsiW